jgi:two-component system, NarL family, sensor kinase
MAPLLQTNWRTKSDRAATTAGGELGEQRWLQAVLDTFPSRAVVLDRELNIVAANRAWQRAAGHDCGLGSSYLSFLNQSSDREAAAAEHGLRQALEGDEGSFCFDYAGTAASGQRWYQLRANLLRGPDRDLLLVCHDDVTEIRAAQEALREIEERIAQSREDERRRIARELHDCTVQKLFAVNLNLAGLKTLLGGSSRKIHKLLSETETLGRECMQELRSISYLLRPPVYDGHEFMPALCSYIDGFCKRSGVRVNLVIPAHAGRMPAKVEDTLFRVVQEGLSNIHRHSQSASATITLMKKSEGVVLEVKDQGKGMPRADAGGAYFAAGGGLAGIQERLRELGGDLEIRTNNPGTAITATIPLENSPEGKGKAEV